MNMLRTLFIIVWVVLVTFFFAAVAILASFFGREGNLPHIVARTWARSILAGSRIKVAVKGLSKIQPSQSYIYMSNHQSNFDIPVLLAHLTVQFRWLAKAELFRIPLFGYSMQKAGYISIDRSNRESAVNSLTKAAHIIENGVSVLIFPEGTRSRDGKIRPFKKGPFILAVDAGVPIIPVVIRGTWSIMPKNKLRIRPGEVTLEILQPIETKNFSRQNKDELLEKVRHTICESFDKNPSDKQ
jgi:1-acyl-sn-glycerol-3-phosphate acyltransferase